MIFADENNEDTDAEKEEEDGPLLELLHL